METPLDDPPVPCAKPRRRRLWRNLPSEERRRLDRDARRIRVPAAATLAVEGEPARFVMGLLAGIAVQCRSLPNDGRLIIAIRYPGDLLAYSDSRGAYLHGAKMATHGTIWRMERGAFETLIADLPALRKAYLEHVTAEIRAAQNRITLLGRGSAVNRVASVVRELAEHVGRLRSGTRVSIPLTREEIGDYVGLEVETVSRAFATLKREGALQLPRANIVEIGDVRKLRALAPFPAFVAR